MKKIKTGLLLWFTIPALLFTSCLMELNSPAFGGEEGDGVNIKVTVSMPQGAPQTYAATANDENLVKKVDVLVFRAGGTSSGWQFEYRTSGSAIQNVGQPDKKQFNVTMRSGNGQLIVVLANVSDEIDGLGAIAVGADRDTLLERLISSNQGKWAAHENDPGEFRPFPMWGEKEGIDINEQTVSIDNICMMRAVARIDVALRQDVIDAGEFQLNEIFVYNSKNKGYIVPNPGNLESGNTKVYKATVPLVASDYEAWNNGIDNPLLYSVPANANKLPRAIYLYEAMGTNEWEKATCLVIGGNYKGNPAYYRVDILDADNAFIDILRNHLYRVTIISVEGPGSETPEEAFHAKKVDMTVEILPWNTGYMEDMIVSGQYYLKVTPSLMNIPFGESSGNAVTVETNVNNWGVVGVTGSPVWTEGQPDVDWITVTGGMSEDRPSGINTLLFDASANGVNDERAAYIHIKAGRLLFPVKVVQDKAKYPVVPVG